MTKNKKKPTSVNRQFNVPKTPASPNARSDDASPFPNLRPSWRFTRMRNYENSRFGCKLESKEGIKLVALLRDNFENQTWNMILHSDNGKRNHFMEVERLSKEAQLLLASAHDDDVPRLMSLRVSSRERIWGIVTPETGTMDVIWWDPEHQVYPVEKHGT